MKRYLLFVGYKYYPAGGADDFIASFDTKEEMIAFADQFCDDEGYDWWNGLDTEQGIAINGWTTDIYKFVSTSMKEDGNTDE